ncbi:MAG: peptidoglycan DD-metalloendopeptidase family protein [Patescibacteria group bacterium]|nr:peptidoglycan DD-metalloendopeptidase family protein [Patescibacteria group bacterium]
MFNKIFFLFFLFLLTTLTFGAEKNYFLKIFNENPQQGDIIIITLSLKNDLNIKEVLLGKEKINFIKIDNNKYLFFIGVNPRKKPGNYKISISLNNNQNIEKIIKVKKRDFPITELKTTPQLEKKGYTPNKIVSNLKNENRIINEITAKFEEEIYFSEKFIYPLKKVINVGDYGNIRKRGNYEVQHLGVDLDGKIGDSIYSINNGKIVLARDFNNYGKTIVINHGGGIYSLYLHLNKIKKKEGEFVKRGEIIAELGNSGYSLEPHLHFSIRINNEKIDPLKFINLFNNFWEQNKNFFTDNNSLKDKSLNFKKFPLEANIYYFLKDIYWGFKKYHGKRKIDTIIIHSSYNTFDEDHYNIDKIIEIYKQYGVSAHYLIDREGKIYRLVEENDIAYHAGKSRMPDGRSEVNLFSIGIELIYHKNESPNELQYQKLNELIRDIKKRHNIKYILGHKDIAPERKDDPWNFDWNRIER